MALQRRHSDPSKPYDPSKELTNNQLKRFSETANKAEEKRAQRDLYKKALNPMKARAEALAKIREKTKQDQDKKKRKLPQLSLLRVVIWSLVLVIFWFWVQFMFPSQ